MFLNNVGNGRIIPLLYDLQGFPCPALVNDIALGEMTDGINERQAPESTKVCATNFGNASMEIHTLVSGALIGFPTH